VNDPRATLLVDEITALSLQTSFILRQLIENGTVMLCLFRLKKNPFL
jgi:hypothetical protein